MKTPVFYKYVHKEHAKIFGMVLGSVSVLFVAVNFLDVVDDAIERHVSALYALGVSIFRLPQALKELGGISILISVLLFMVIASRNLETVILRALGIELGRFRGIFVKQAAVLSALLVINSLFLAPKALLVANDIYYGVIKGEKRYKKVSPVKMWIKHSGYICYLGFFNERGPSIMDLRCYKRDKGTRRLIVAPAVVWEKGWIAKNIKEWDIGKNRSFFKRFSHKKLNFFLPSPEEISSRKKRSEEMTAPELISVVISLSSEGIDSTRYVKDLLDRIFISLFPIAMVLFAFPLGITEPRKAQVSLAFIKGIIIALSAYSIYYLLESLGGKGILHPFLASAIPFGLVLWTGKRFSERVDR